MHLTSEKIDFETLPNPGDKFNLLEVIGEGTYGEVYSAIDLELEAEQGKDARVAIKVLENLPENIEEAEEEFLVLKNFSIHPNLPAFYGLYFKRASRPQDSQLWYVMELCSGGSVTDLAQGLKKFEGRHLTEIQIAYIVREVVDALIHLHTHRCIHRDVKGHNILLTADGRIKLVDFGVAAHLKETFARRNTSIGTPYWMSPEIIACERQVDASYDSRCDVWSLGITAIEFADAEPPLADLHPMRALFQIPRNPPPTFSKPHDWSREFNDFITECLVKDLEQRPYMVELRQHPFFELISHVPEDIIRQEITRDIQVVKAHGDLVKREPEVTTKHGKLKTDRKSKLQTMFVDDLVSLATLDEDTILDQLKNRFEEKQPYTYIGDILIAFNPYDALGIYNEFYQFKYRAANSADIPPHIFSMADQAYHSMLHQKRSQNVVFSGESGSGKTENAKFLLQHLVYLGKAPNRNLESKIMQIDCILEAFGNAATGLNENASRFVKYLETTFTRTGKITGAKISVYVLEESRVNKQLRRERNFHIFYYLIHGRGNEFGLDKTRCTYLNNFEKSSEATNENLKKLESINTGLSLLGFRQEEIESIYKILAAILHLGEITFNEENKGDGCSIKNMEELETAASLLGLSVGDLGLCFTTKSVITSGESFLRRNSAEEAQSIKDSLARGLYNRVFRWIVYQINALLGISRLAYGDPLSIGILDIFGFETFQENSLEQLSINIINEQLQFLFNQHVFNWEQQEYMAECIDLEIVHYADNRPILELGLGKPLGILSLLDEESRLSRANDRTLLDKLNLKLQTSKFYVSSKRKNDRSFQVRHYAGKVKYNIKGFMEKNMNLHLPEIVQTIRESTNDVVKTLYKCLLTRTGDLYIQRSGNIAEKEEELGLASQTRSHTTLATSMRFSLMDLMSKLLGGELHFVKCVKPNDLGLPNQFDQAKVLWQLRYNGVLEAIKLRQLGYSHRFTFVEFLKSYCFLAFNFDERVVADRDSCRLLLLRLKLDNWAIGKTKVFLKYYHVEYLAKLCEQQVRSIIFVQACVRRWLAKICIKKGMWKVARTVVSAQRAAKTWMNVRKRVADAKRFGECEPSKKRGSMIRSKLLGEEISIHDINLTEEEKAAILIQSHYRGFRVRKQWGPILEERIKQIVLQHDKREDAEKALREEGLNEQDAALVLQRFYRKWKVQHQQSSEEENKDHRKQDERKLQLDNWDAPFRIMESHMKDLRAGRIKREKVDMAAHRREMIIAGLQSQDLANQEREKVVAGKWQNVITAGIPDNEKKPRSTPRLKKLSKFGIQMLETAMEKKVQELRKPPKQIELKKIDVKDVLEVTLKPTVFKKEVEEDQDSEQSSAFDFRKNLRKAGHRPTDSLKKGWSQKNEA